MNNSISVSGLDESSLGACRVEVDEYVPLRFRSYEDALGVKYVRLGNFSGSLLEPLLDPHSMTIRGLTLTSFDVVYQPREIVELPRSTGLPVVAAAGGFVGPAGAQRADIKEGFSVATGADFVEIDLSELAGAQYVIAGGAVEFYVKAENLVGMRVVGLTLWQVSMVRAQRTV